MADGSRIIRQRQLAIRREMDRRGLLLKIVAQDSGIPYPTLATYFPADPAAEPAQIPGGAIYALADTKALPADLLSDLMPHGWAIVQVPEGIDYDDVSGACQDFIAAKERAHHPDSEAGRDIGPTEHAELGAKVVRLRA
jgi:hypothetical protein